MSKPGAKKKTVLLFLAVAGVLTIAYEIILHTVPKDLTIRNWYMNLGLFMIIAWQVAILIATWQISFRVFGITESKAARYTGRIAVWVCCISILIILAFLWIWWALRIDSEYLNENGTITVGHDVWLDGTDYSLWEKKGIFYRKYIRESYNREDTDPSQTKEQFMEENYPDIYVHQQEQTTQVPSDSPKTQENDQPDRGSTDSTDTGSDSHDNQAVSDRMNDGLVAVYEQLAAGKKEYSFTTSWSSHGEPQAILYENDGIVRFVRYDRLSGNGKCYLYVYYESEKAQDGSWSPADARILDMFAYEISTGRTVASGKKAWADAGNAEYREMTGE